MKLLGHILGNLLTLLSSVYLLAMEPTAKPFVMIEPTPAVQSSKKSDLRQSIDCNIQENLDEHAEYLVNTVIPRVGAELQTLTKPVQQPNGEWMQVADSIDFGDLFHVHVRVPLTNMYTPQGLSPIMKDSQRYHLQYHAWESGELFRQKWLNELAAMNNPQIRDWSIKQSEFLELWETGGSYTGPIKYPASTDNETFANLVEIYYQESGKDQYPATMDPAWVKARLADRLTYLDRGRRNYPARLTQNRSVVSKDDKFEILGRNGGDLPGFEQPSNIYFDERTADSAVNNILKKAEALGFPFLVNRASPLVNDRLFGPDWDWATNDALVLELQVAASLAEDPFYTFKTIFGDVYGFQNHFILAWDNDYFYSVLYNIRCDQNMKLSEATNF